MVSSAALKPFYMSSASLLTLRSPSKARLPFPSLSKPSTLLRFSSRSPFPPPFSPSLPIKRRPPFPPLVAQTSGWARQEEDEKDELREEAIEGGASEWEEDEEPTTEDGPVMQGVPEGSDGFVEEVDGEDDDAYPEPPEEAKLFAGNLPYDMDSEKLAQLFERAGVVEVAEVIYNRDTDQSRGFGFVTMRTVEEAEKAVEMLHRYEINGRPLTVNKAAPKGTRVERAPQGSAPSYRVYVGNLPWQVDDARLEQVFSEHGKVLEARVLYDRESGRSRGFGFVTMSTKEELDDAIAALDGQSLDGRALRVNVAEDRPRRVF